MHSDIRKTILEVARVSFNEKGYDHVSMREIAEECGIAVGNLTYHFHRKPDIAKAIMEDAFIEAKPETPIHSLADLTDQFSRMLDTLTHYAFYFIDDTFIGDQNDHNSAIRVRLMKGFEQLSQDGLFNSSFDKQTQEEILGILLMSHITWMRLTFRAPTAPSKTELLRGHWAVLKPYLTERGREELAKLPSLM